MRFTILCSLLLLAWSADLAAQGHDESEPHGIRCGLTLLAEALAQSDPDAKERALASLQQNGARRQMDHSIVSRDGHFRIHYDVSGFNAVPLFDGDNNGIPDFVDSTAYYLDEAWRVMIDECDWIAPPPDNVAPGVGGPDGLLDAYLLEQDLELYGAAFPDINGSLGDSKVSGYLVLDNNFSEFQTQGIAGLRVTTAHEFHHLIQFASYRYDLSQLSLYESTATFMEYKLHPEIRDYMNYVDAFMNGPQNHPYSTNNTGDRVTGYAHMAFPLMLDDRSEQDIVRSVWEKFADNGAQFTAWNSALLESDLPFNLNTAYCEFARAMYHSGARSPDTASLPTGDEFSTMLAAAVHQLPDEEIRVVEGALSPLAFGIWRFLIGNPLSQTPDTLDLLVTNARSNLGTGGRQWINNPEEFTLEVSTRAGSGFTPIMFRNDTIFYRGSFPHAEFCIDPFINGSNGTIVTSLPSPQPFVNDGGSDMIFAINLDPTEVTTWELVLYTTDMRLVRQRTGSGLEFLQNMRGVRWDGRDVSGTVVPSGVYLYTLQVNDREPVVGKIAVVHP